MYYAELENWFKIEPEVKIFYGTGEMGFNVRWLVFKSM